MKKHEVCWYESDDGKMFMDEDECMNHEAEMLYHQSGVRFYDIDWNPIEFKTDNDYTYDHADYIVIDRTNENSKRFVDYMNDNFGWCLLKDVYDTDGDTFVLEMTKVTPVSSHLVY